ncbi:MAG: gliding motility-associated C-terminal domain-containing protein [Flavobacteriales bacterium]
MRTVFLLFTLLFLTNLASSQGFIENRGQWAEDFAYKLDLKDGAVFLESEQLTFHIVDKSGLYGVHFQRDSSLADNIEHHHAFRLEFMGANHDCSKTTSRPYPHYVNYFLGSDESKWQSYITPKHEVIYNQLYEGIDLHVIENNDRLKYEFQLEPGVDPRTIRIRFEGLSDLKLDRHGNLLMQTSIIDIMESRPVVYQKRGKHKWEIPAEFVIAGNVVSYAIQDYDTNLPLIIDPELVFSTFSGSTADNWGFTATPDHQGHAFSGSAASGTGYPTTSGAYDISFNGQVPGAFGSVPGDVCITKFSEDGASLIYSTYFGGSSNEIPHSMICDDNGILYVFGTTGSDDLPTTSGAISRSHKGGNDVEPTMGIPYNDGADMFIAKFNATGSSLLAATYLGGEGTDGLNLDNNLRYNYADDARGEITLDKDGNVLIISSTTSNNFPESSKGFQSAKSTGQDAIVAKLKNSLKDIIWSTYLGGNGADAGYGITVASDNSIYVCGGTTSTNFPTRTGGFQLSKDQQEDAFISHISENGKVLEHSTYFGSNRYDQMYLIQVDRFNNPHVFGQTEHTGSDFIFNAGINDAGGSQVIAKFRPDLGSLIWSTQIGSTPGHPNISPTALLVDVCNSIYIAGWGGFTNESNGDQALESVAGLPTTTNAEKQDTDPAESDFYLAVFESDMNSIIYGTYFGGNQEPNSFDAEHVDGGTSRFDRSGKVYQAVCAGCGSSDEFTVTEGAWSETNNSTNCNSAIFKFDFELPIIIANFQSPLFGCAPFTVNFDNQSNVQSATSFFWTENGIQFSTAANPSRIFTQPGEYVIQLVISDPNSCNLTDTVFQVIQIKSDSTYYLPTIDTCIGTPVVIGPDQDVYGISENAQFSWTPSNLVDDPNVINPTATVNKDTEFQLIVNYGGCQERFIQKIGVDTIPIETSRDTIVCSNFTPFNIKGTANGQAEFFQWSDKPDFSNVLSNDSVLPINSLTLPINRFYFKAVQSNGCPTFDTVKITVSDYDFHLTNDTFICKNDEARIEVVSNNPENTYYYYWTRNFYLSDPNQELLTDSSSNFLEIQNSESRTYHVYGKSKQVLGCFAYDSVLVNVSKLDRSLVKASADVDTFYLGQSFQLHGEPSEGFYQYWTPGTYLSDSTISDPIAQPKKAMTYVYTASDREVPQCSFSDTVEVAPYEIICGEPEVFLPSAFTPNLDGKNDVIYLRGRNVKELELAIYDRWGRLMFETHDQSIGWDGTFNGLKVQNGVYVYYYEATCIDEQRIYREGNITIFGQ